MNRRSLFKLFGVCCVGFLSVIGVLSFFGCYNNTPPEYSGFIKVSDGKLVDENGLQYSIKGINTTDFHSSDFGNQGVAHTYEGYVDMASYGMNTVRICLNAAKFEEQIDGEWVIKTEGIEKLKESVSNAAAAGLRCIIDMTCPPECGINSYDSNRDKENDINYRSLVENSDLQDRFIRIWEAIAENFADNKNVIAYGLVNEPVAPRDGEISDISLQDAVDKYENLLQRTINAIRIFDTNHIIILQRLCATYDKNLSGNIATTVPLTWGGALPEMNQPLVNDPQKNIMLEFHSYKKRIVYTEGDVIYGWGQTAVAPDINRDNVVPYTGDTSSAWVTWDRWGAQGVRTNSVVSTAEYETAISNEDFDEINTNWFTAVSQVNRLYDDEEVKSLYDFAHMGLSLNFYFGSGNMRYWVDNLKISKTNSDGSVEEFELDFNDTNKLRMLGGYQIFRYIVDNPFKPGDKLMQFDGSMTSGSGYNGFYSFTLLSALPFLENEKWEVSADILAVGDTDGVDASYARYIASGNRYALVNPDKPAVIYQNKVGLQETFQNYMDACAKYDCPVYIGELGAQYNTLDEDPNAEKWFKDVAALLKQYNIGFTWHSLVGGNYGLYIDRPATKENKHTIIDAGFINYLFK